MERVSGRGNVFDAQDLDRRAGPAPLIRRPRSSNIALIFAQVWPDDDRIAGLSVPVRTSRVATGPRSGPSRLDDDAEWISIRIRLEVQDFSLDENALE